MSAGRKIIEEVVDEKKSAPLRLIEISKNAKIATSKPKFNFFKDEPIIAGILIGLAVILVAAIVAAVIFSGGLATLPIAAASATIGTFITGIIGASISATAIYVIGAAVIGIGMAAAGLALGAVGGFIAFIKNKLSNKAKENSSSKPKEAGTIKLLPKSSRAKKNSSNILKEADIKELCPKNNEGEIETYFVPSEKLKQLYQKKSALGQQSMFGENNLSQKSNKKDTDIENVIIFLRKYLDYFIAPFENQTEFKKWLAKRPKDIKLPKELTMIFVRIINDKLVVRSLPFEEAILGEIMFDEKNKTIKEIKGGTGIIAGKRKGGLVRNDEESIRLLLERNTDLLNLLNKHRTNATTIKHIEGWYNRNTKGCFGFRW